MLTFSLQSTKEGGVGKGQGREGKKEKKRKREKRKEKERDCSNTWAKPKASSKAVKHLNFSNVWEEEFSSTLLGSSGWSKN